MKTKSTIAAYILLSSLLVNYLPSSDIKAQIKPNKIEIAQTNMTEDFIVLSGRYKIKPEKRERFLQLALAGMEKTREETGNISYNLYEQVGVPNSFIYFEEWKSREALAAHLKQPYITPLLAEFSDLVEGDANVRIYDIDSYTEGL